MVGSISRIKIKINIESKIRNPNKKYQADRQSFDAWNRAWKGFNAMETIIASDTGIDDLSEGGSWITYEAKREKKTLGTGGVQESQVSILWNCGLWAHHVG